MADLDCGIGAQARKAADRLATALEDAGFDVGREFPGLYGDIGKQGTGVVRIGDLEVATANQLADVLWRAANAGITATTEEGHD